MARFAPFVWLPYCSSPWNSCRLPFSLRDRNWACHPYAISVLADIFREISERRQLIVSTQSVELVNQLEPEDIIVVDQEDGPPSSGASMGRSLPSGWKNTP